MYSLYASALRTNVLYRLHFAWQYSFLSGQPRHGLIGLFIFIPRPAVPCVYRSSPIRVPVCPALAGLTSDLIECLAVLPFKYSFYDRPAAERTWLRFYVLHNPLYISARRQVGKPTFIVTPSCDDAAITFSFCSILIMYTR